MPNTYDAVFIGGGHNGLVAAAYLAKAGRKVLVLEGRPIVGGAAVTEEFFPGFHFSACADGAGRLLPQVARDLELNKFGLELLPADPVLFAPQPDGSQLAIWRDTARTIQAIERFSKKDAARYPDFAERVGKISDLIAGLMTMIPPDLPDIGRADLPELLKLLGPARRLGAKELTNTLRVLPMSVADFLDEWFETEALKGLLAAWGVKGITWGPRAAGTAYLLLYACAGSTGGVINSAGVVRGGMGALTKAIADAARRHGADIRTSAQVAQILVKDDRATGVALADGQEIAAQVVVSNADPRMTFLKLLDARHLEAHFLRQIRNIKYRGSGARVHLALGALPKFTALDGGSPMHGHIQISPSIDYLEHAYDDAKYGRFSHRPYLDVLIPSLTDPSLAPPGKHVMSISAQYAPYHLRQSEWEAQREPLGDAVIETLALYAPNLKDVILQRKVLTPLDLENVYGLPEGNPNHGEMTLDQFFYMRPVPGYARYRTPVPGLYLCGAGTHPGGGVTGANGMNAAQVILKENRS